MKEKYNEIVRRKFGFREDFDRETRFDLKTQVGDYEISTVDLGINHQFDDDLPPLYYETMIFNCEQEENQFEYYQERYSTKEEAIVGHEKAIEYVKENLKEK